MRKRKLSLDKKRGARKCGGNTMQHAHGYRPRNNLGSFGVLVSDYVHGPDRPKSSVAAC